MAYSKIKSAVEGGIGVITLADPTTLNAAGLDRWPRLAGRPSTRMKAADLGPLRGADRRRPRLLLGGQPLARGPDAAAGGNADLEALSGRGC